MAKKALNNKDKVIRPKKNSGDTVKRTLGLMLAAVAFIIYCNTIHHDYVLDDYSLISENTVTVQGVKSIPAIFGNFYRYGYNSTHDGIYRPLSVAMFALEWSLSPNNPLLGHIINILFYVLTAWVVFITLARLLKKYSVVLPFVITLLFITHPIHTEVVANIKSRDELLCFLFSWITLYFLLDYVELLSKKKLGIALLFYFAAFFSKETAITMIVVIPVTLYFFTGITKKQMLVSTTCLALVAVVFLLIRAKILGGGKPYAVSGVENSLLLAANKSDQMATAIKILGQYLALLIYPNNLLYDRSFNQIPIVSFVKPVVITSLLAHAGLAFYAVWRFFKKDLLAFGILFYLTTLSLFSNLILIIGAAMADRFAYFASFGFCFSLAVILMRIVPPSPPSGIYLNLRDFFTKNKALIYVVLVIASFYSIKSIKRNANWKNNYTLFKHDLKYAPDNARAHAFFGNELIKNASVLEEPDVLKRSDLYNQGIQELQRSLQIYPNHADALSSIGSGYFQMNRMDSAEYYFKKAVTYDSSNLSRLGDFYMATKNYPGAIEALKKTLEFKPYYLDAYINLGICYGTIKEYTNAIIYLNRALALQPKNAQIHYFLSTAYKYSGDVLNYEKHYQEAFNLDGSLEKP